jgi:parallel beta-helix repeat protein
MTYTFKLSRRLAVSRYFGMLALLLVLGACADHDLLDTSDADTPARVPDSRFEVSPRFVFAEVNQRIRLEARESRPRRDSSGITVEWTATGGTVTSDGVFFAASAGEYKVVGRARGRHKSDTSTVTVGDSTPNVVRVQISPDPVQLSPAGTQQFTAAGVLADGSPTTIGAVWRAEGGTIDAGGGYVAGAAAGHYRVIATNVSGTLADTADVTITVPAPAADSSTLEVTPATSTLSPGASQQFVARKRLSDGTTTTTQAQFSATGGTITAAGEFTAGQSPGTYRIIAKTQDSLADTVAVTIAAASPTPTGPVIQPGASIQAAVDANPPGTAFLLKAGVHRMQQITPKSGNSFTGEAGTVLSGARLLTGFTRSGTSWSVGGQTQQGRATDPVHCEPGFEGCQWPEDMFLDDRLLLRVTSLAQVGPGKWYFDYAGDRVYLGDDPTGRRAEISVSEFAFGGRASNVTLRQLVIEKYASPAQAAAIQGDDAPGWQVEDCEVRQSHGTGIRIGDRWHVRGCRVHDNGQLGLARGGTGSVIEECDIYQNKTVPFKTGFAGGALKFSKSTGLVFQNNRVHDNLGNGIWLDIDNIDYEVRGNTVYDNASQGIFVEISYAGKVYNNKVYGNGFERGSSWLYGAGILIAASPNVEVYGNEVSNNANGIAAIQQDRGTGEYGPHEISNLYVHDNVVTMTQGKTGLAQKVGDNSYFTSRNNRWARNTYILGRSTAYFTWAGLSLSEGGWRQQGQDVDGTFRR